MASSQKVYIVMSYFRDLRDPTEKGDHPLSVIQGAFTTLPNAQTKMRQLVRRHPPASHGSNVDAFLADSGNWVSIKVDPGDSNVTAMGYRYVTVTDDEQAIWVQEMAVREEGVKEFRQPEIPRDEWLFDKKNPYVESRHGLRDR